MPTLEAWEVKEGRRCMLPLAAVPVLLVGVRKGKTVAIVWSQPCASSSTCISSPMSCFFFVYGNGNPSHTYEVQFVEHVKSDPEAR